MYRGGIRSLQNKHNSCTVLSVFSKSSRVSSEGRGVQVCVYRAADLSAHLGNLGISALSFALLWEMVARALEPVVRQVGRLQLLCLEEGIF